MVAPGPWDTADSQRKVGTLFWSQVYHISRKIKAQCKQAVLVLYLRCSVFVNKVAKSVPGTYLTLPVQGEKEFRGGGNLKNSNVC